MPCVPSFADSPHRQTYGSPTTSTFRRAQDHFIKSLASYSVICYLLQLKDRHNGNILVDREGHLIRSSFHFSCTPWYLVADRLSWPDIDFGFLLSNSPGSLGFEMAPFKLPQDYIDVLGGFEGEKFLEFRKLFKRAFRDARKHAERIITLVELMQKGSFFFFSSLSLSGGAGADPELRDVKTRTCRASRTGTSRRSSFGSGSSSR